MVIKVKLLLTVLIACAITPSILCAQERTAIQILEKALRKHQIGNSNYEIIASGKHFNDSHLRNPLQLNEYEVELKLTALGDTVRLAFHFLRNGKESQNRALITKDSLYQYSEKKACYQSVHPQNTVSEMIRSLYFQPALLLSYLLEKKALIHFESRTADQDIEVTNTLPNGEKWILTIDQDFTCQSFKYGYFHYFYGDVEEGIAWNEYKKVENSQFPSSVRVFDQGFLTFDLNLELRKLTENTNPRDAPIQGSKSFRELNERIISKEKITLNEIEDGIFEILLPETNNRLLIGEFYDFLILLEGSYHSMNGDLILEVLREKFPDKPVRYWSFSHCHQQYMGFSRSMAANQTIIIAKENEATFIRQLCKKPFSLRPDSQEEKRVTPRFQMLDDSITIRDQQNQLVIFSIESDHTENYLIFYFPRQKICFVGDLLFVAEDGDKPIWGRSVTFYNEVIERLKLDIQTFYTSWPLEYYGFKNTVSIGEIKL